MDTRWRQDPEVFELIEYLNRAEVKYDWSVLADTEVGMIMRELDRCRKDFVYAARNYFWITNKDLQDQLLTLNQGQELIFQKMLELKEKGRLSNKAVKLIIIKGRQLGCSTLIEALIAWRTIFFSNVNAIVVSYDRSHTADVLFPIMTTIYDRLPWWMKPECAMRRGDEGLWFATKDQKSRSENIGLNSRVYVKAANTTTSVGMGIRISAAHVSEFAAYDEKTAKTIIDEEMRHALIDSCDTFAVLESTAKGANKYAHTLWKQCEELAEQADWYPLFLPAFFETKRSMPPPKKWAIKNPEQLIRDQVVTQWLRCDNKRCLGYHMRTAQGQDRAETLCPTCNIGTMHPYNLTDDQVYFMEYHRINSARDENAAKKLKQELCVSSLEAFQIYGIQLFGTKAQEFAAKCVREPVAVGDFDSAGRFHGPDKNSERGRVHFERHHLWPCFVPDCPIDHDPDENPCLIWEWPIKDAAYTCGADVAEGLGGKADFSVGVVTINTHQGADRQVATWRSNLIDPITFAYKLNWLGLFYNVALMSVECNKYDSCLGALRFNLNYPHMYRWKHIDSININSNKLGWFTDMKSRPRLWQTFKLWLNQEMFVVRSRNCYNEMLNFVKDDEDSMMAGGDKHEHDDEVIAIMIALFCAKEGQFWNPIMGIAVPEAQLTKETAAYTIRCRACMTEWYQNTVEDRALDPSSFGPEVDSNGLVKTSGGMRCEKCGNRSVEITRNQTIGKRIETDGDIVAELGRGGWSPDNEWDKAVQILDYELL